MAFCAIGATRRPNRLAAACCFVNDCCAHANIAAKGVMSHARVHVSLSGPFTFAIGD
jgi:hypothetical protein